MSSQIPGSVTWCAEKSQTVAHRDEVLFITVVSHISSRSVRQILAESSWPPSRPWKQLSQGHVPWCSQGLTSLEFSFSTSWTQTWHFQSLGTSRLSRSLQGDMDLTHLSLPRVQPAGGANTILCHGYNLSSQTGSQQGSPTRADLANKDQSKETTHTSAISHVLPHRTACLIQQIHIFFVFSLLTRYLWKSYLLSDNPFEFQLWLRFPTSPLPVSLLGIPHLLSHSAQTPFFLVWAPPGLLR